MARILLVDDEYSILEPLSEFLRERGHTIYQASTGSDGVKLFYEQRPDIIFLDVRLPDRDGLEILAQITEEGLPVKIIIMSAYQDMESTIWAMKHGAFDYIHKPWNGHDVEKTVEKAWQILQAEQDIPQLQVIGRLPDPDVIIGQDDNMLDMFKTIGLVCQNRAPLLIQGETGTGKELVAKIIHRNSSYHQDPFVIMDCSATVENLIESELFGYEKGAFTGANQTHKGKIEAAGHGTLFLDEIGELPVTVQGKFLGFLQRNEYMRVGGHQMLAASCRIIAATNRNLAGMVQTGQFKEDLYYRLNVISITVPPLRERPSDIPLLVHHILQKINAKLGTDISKLQDSAIERLMAHPWTGNVRELENTLVEAAVRAHGKVILLEDVETILSKTEPQHEDTLPSAALTSMEKDHIEKILIEEDWNQTHAARRLGISRPTLRSKMQKYDIKQPA